jgi:Dna[CI] antecedent, DciA
MKKNFTNISTVLGQILEKHKLSHIFFLENIRQNWVSFDKTIAAHARPIKYDEKLKKLTLKIDNASWKKEFLVNKELLRIKIQNTFRNIEINNIEIV